MSGDQPLAVPPEEADAAFRSLYAEHGPALLRLSTALTGGDRGRAEDLVQETMLRAWTHRNNVDIQHRSPRSWLTTADCAAVRAPPDPATLADRLGDEVIRYVGHAPKDDVTLLVVYRDGSTTAGLAHARMA